MTAIELKTLLIHRISEINDVSFLKALKTILDTKTDTGIIQLTQDQLDDIMASKKEIVQGLFIENSVLDTERLYGILEFYIQRNKSKTYSIKLQRLINKEVKLLIKNPDLGLRTTEDSTRGLIIQDYIVYYELTHDKIIIHTIWDSRQNPDYKTIK
jgi:plasmid stabilization system protein ParE